MAPPTPNLAMDFIRIHRVITRSTGIALNRGKEYLTDGFANQRILTGFSRYTHCLASVLNSHHQAEDIVAFPAFKKVLLVAPYTQLEADHHEIEGLLVQISTSINMLSTTQVTDGVRRIVDTLQKFSAIWYPHIDLEEKYFSISILDGALSKEEQGNLSLGIAKLSQARAGPPEWVIPFILYNMDMDDRANMAARLPPAMINELVPKVWLEQWEPMKPFLLD